MKRLLIGFGAAIFLGGLVTWLLSPPSHEAFALLKVSHRAQSILRSTEPSPDDFDLFKRTQAQLFLSNLVLSAAVREAKITRLATIQEHKESPQAWLRENLVVDFPGDAEIMRVSLRGSRPKELVVILDTIVDKYMKEVVHYDRDQRLRREQILTDILAKYNEDWRDKARILAEMERVQKVGTSHDAQVEKSLALATFQDALARRSDLRRQLNENEMQIMLLEARQAVASVTSETQRNGDSEKLTLPQLRQQRAFLEAKLAEADEEIARASEKLKTVVSHSEVVAGKQQELQALEKLRAEIREEQEHLKLDRMSPDRIEELDKAQLSFQAGDVQPWNAMLAAVALCGLALVAVGFAVPDRRQPASK